MPYIVRQRGREWCVFTRGAAGEPQGEPHGCHPTEAQARAQQSALYVHAGDKTMSDTDVLITYGGEVKSLGEGKVGGYLCRFTDPSDPDLTGDFFTAETDFGVEFPARTPVLFHHGLDPLMGKKALGHADLSLTDEGVWIEWDLQVEEARREYLQRPEVRQKRERLLRHIAKKNLGWSSGVPSNTVERAEVRPGVYHLKSWFLGADASLTPTPAEPYCQAVSLKTLAEYEPACGECERRSLAENTESLTDSLDELTVRYRQIAAAEIKRGNPQFTTARRERLEALYATLGELLKETAPREEAAATTEPEPATEPAMATPREVAAPLFPADDSQTARLVGAAFSAAFRPD